MPRLAPGVELIGRYQGSGLKSPIYLARRADGKVVQMSTLLYAVAKGIDGRRSTADIAARTTPRVGRKLAPEDVLFLIERKLRPAGLASIGDMPPLRPIAATQALGLRFKFRVIPEQWVGAATTVCRPLFHWMVAAIVLLFVGVFDEWLLFDHGLAQAARTLLYQPSLALGLLAITIGSTAFHEIGHATACRYGGAKPGPIGVGLYLAWPVFYSDVTDSYRLGRGARVRTDLGGVYFNLIATVATACAYMATSWEPLLLAIVLIQLDALHQFFPFFRLDGYYVASDLIGVPDLFMRMRPMLLSFIPGRPLHPVIKALKPWARYAVATWVYLTFLVVAVLYGLLLYALPRILATAQQSMQLQLFVTSYAVRHGDTPTAVLAGFNVAMLLLPLFALGLTAFVVLRRLWRWWWSSNERPTFRVATAMAAAVVLAVALPAMSSPVAYQPISPNERGTVPSPGSIGQALWPAQPQGALPAWWSAPSPTPSSRPSTTTPAPSPAPSATPAPSPSPSPSPAPTDSPTPSPSDSPSPSPTPT